MSATVNRGTIVSAARLIVERDGIDALTMRRLASEMGTKPMTLYYHVPNKGALLQALLDRTAADIPWPTVTGEPRDRMVAVIVEMADRLAEIDWIIPVLGRATQVGASALTLFDQFLSAALELGATPREAFSAWRSCWYLVSSELSWRSRRQSVGNAGDAAGSGGVEELWHETLDPGLLDSAPTVQSLLPQLKDFSDHYDLEQAVADQIDGAVARWAAGAAS